MRHCQLLTVTTTGLMSLASRHGMQRASLSGPHCDHKRVAIDHVQRGKHAGSVPYRQVVPGALHPVADRHPAAELLV